VVQELPARPVRDELIRHYLNLALQCKRLRAVYQGVEPAPADLPMPSVHAAGPGQAPAARKTPPPLKLLKLTLPQTGHSTGPIELLLHPTSYLPLVVRYTATDPRTGQQAQFEERLSDWRAVSGVSMAYFVEQRIGPRILAQQSLISHRINK